MHYMCNVATGMTSRLLCCLLAACRLGVAGAALHVLKPPEVTRAIVEALQKNFVFKGIPENVLVEVGYAGRLLQLVATD